MSYSFGVPLLPLLSSNGSASSDHSNVMGNINEEKHGCADVMVSLGGVAFISLSVDRRVVHQKIKKILLGMKIFVVY